MTVSLMARWYSLVSLNAAQLAMVAVGRLSDNLARPGWPLARRLSFCCTPLSL